MIEDTGIRLSDPEAFALEMDTVKTQFLGNKLAALKELTSHSSTLAGTFLKGQTHHISRLAKLWITIDKMMTLQGVVDGNETIRTA